MSEQQTTTRGLGSAPRPAPRPRYRPELDGLRALGIVLVIVHHSLQPLEFGGYVGVDIFFVLSGYLITTILLREWRATGRIRYRAFALRRAVRLYPALLAAVVVILPFGYHLWGTKHLVEAALALTYTTPLVVEVFGKGSQIWLHTWSLGIEEAFYVVWPLALVALLRRTRRIRPVWWAVAVGLLLFAGQAVLVGTTGKSDYFLRGGALFLGCALALGLERRPDIAVARAAAPLGMTLVVCAVVVAGRPELQATAYLLASVGTVLLIAGFTVRPSRLSRFFGAPPLAYIGRISYELYLWHYAVLMVFALWTGRPLIEVAPVAIPLSIGLAVATHHILDHRIARWKRRGEAGPAPAA